MIAGINRQIKCVWQHLMSNRSNSYYHLKYDSHLCYELNNGTNMIKSPFSNMNDHLCLSIIIKWYLRVYFPIIMVPDMNIWQVKRKICIILFQAMSIALNNSTYGKVNQLKVWKFFNINGYVFLLPIIPMERCDICSY